MKRQFVGRLWLQLVVRHYIACRDGDEVKRQKLFDLIDGLTDEYSDAIEAEITVYQREEE